MLTSKSDRELMVMPDDGLEPVVRAVDRAIDSLHVKMFLFSEPALIAAVIAAHRRGVRARVMLNGARRSGEIENGDTRASLVAAGVEVRETDPRFAVTHEKSMVVDGRLAMIHSFNWAPANFTQTRDYAIVTTDPLEVSEVLACFNADWARAEFDPGPAHLIWCPGKARERIARFIDGARSYLYVQNERYQDLTIIERLVRARRRGLRVRLMSLPPHALKEKKLLEGVNCMRLMHDVDIKVHRLKEPQLHGKLMLADGNRAIIGSMNFAPGSFDERRELAIELTDEHIVSRLRATFEKDWDNSRSIDLSDEGIKRDLDKHHIKDGGSLALG